MMSALASLQKQFLLEKQVSNTSEVIE